MSEIPNSTPNSPAPGPLPPLDGDDFRNQELPAGQEAAEELSALYGGWLERRGIDPANTPRLTMGRRELDLFRNAPSNYLEYARRLYGIPQDDQTDCQYAL